ncbi:hypothetical protein [Candidatus Vondammii sp. HM_W22]|nr:hypothetical protein [Candidatus Vondammii sp. HM_W22]
MLNFQIGVTIPEDRIKEPEISLNVETLGDEALMQNQTDKLRELIKVDV